MKAFAAIGLVGVVGMWLGSGFGHAGPEVHSGEVRRHGVSAFGELKYQPDFPNFDYVNPQAPKGGLISLVGSSSVTTFDSFNRFILKGDAAQGLELLFDTLMAPAQDEADSYYGLVASHAKVGPGRGAVTFWLRPEARFADGSPITADDIVFTFEIIKAKGHPFHRLQLGDVVKAERLDRLTVKYVFKGRQTRDLPLVVAALPVLSKAFYSKHDFSKTSLRPPLGSGPYRIRDFKVGRHVTYQLREDYWARDLNVNRGRFNFSTVRFEYFRDRAAELENFKAGVFDLKEEFTSRVWATGYDFAAVRDGRVKLLTLPDDNPSGAQGFFVNTRRAKFSDRRVREALGLVFDFPWTNRTMFFGLYRRTESFFENSPLKARGVATPDELALLKDAGLQDAGGPLKIEFASRPAVRPEQSDGSGRDRRLMRRAHELLAKAGWNLGGDGTSRLLRNGAGETLDIEFLLFDSGFERVLAPYVRNLRALGVNAWIRRVDPAQYQRRVKSYDFDITISRFVMRLTPGAELVNYFSSGAAKQQGSRNLAGISEPYVDALIRKVMESGTRDELTLATHALDRVLRAGHYWIPQWYKAAHHIAFWDKFSRPKVKPKYGRGIIDTWWYDAGKAASLERP